MNAFTEEKEPICFQISEKQLAQGVNFTFTLITMIGLTQF